MNRRTAALSANERQIGFRNYLKHISWNGLGVSLLNQTIVSLMAIHVGASNLELGYISSAFHVTGLASILVPRLFRGRRITKLFGWGWMIRGFFAVLYAFVLFMGDPAARVFIIVVFTAFCLSRTVGFSVAYAVQRDLLRSREASGALVQLNIRLAWAQLASQVLGFVLLSVGFLEGLRGLVLITFIGAVMNTVASWYLLKVPGHGVVEPQPARGAFQTFLWSMRRREHAVPLLIHVLGMGLIVVFAFQVVFLRRILGLPNNVAILMVILEAICAIIANTALKPFTGVIGDKPLLIVSSAGLVAVALIWTVIPPTLPVPVYFALGFVAFLFKRSLLTLKGSVMIKSIPEHDRVSYTSAANVLLAITTLLVGLVAGGLADVAAAMPWLVVHDYSLTFLFAAALAAVTTLLCTRLIGSRDLSLRETADLMLSASKLRAFLDAYQLDLAVDPSRRETRLLSLGRSFTPVATARLQELLAGPATSEKERVLRVLFRSPRPELVYDIIGEARDAASYTRRDAIFCLGAYHQPAAERALREIAGLATEGVSHEPDPDPEAVAVALKSLARVYEHRPDDDPLRLEALDRIRAELGDGMTPRAELDLTLAEAILDPQGPQLSRLFEHAVRHGSERFAATRFMIAFDRIGLEPRFEGYLRAETRWAGRGFEDIIEDATEFHVFQEERARLLRLAEADGYADLWRWIATHVTAVTAKSRWARALKTSLETACVRVPALDPNLRRLTTLAALYTLHRLFEAEADDEPEDAGDRR